MSDDEADQLFTRLSDKLRLSMVEFGWQLDSLKVALDAAGDDPEAMERAIAEHLPETSRPREEKR